jgi:hypothetical protein
MEPATRAPHRPSLWLLLAWLVVGAVAVPPVRATPEPCGYETRPPAGWRAGHPDASTWHGPLAELPALPNQTTFLTPAECESLPSRADPPLSRPVFATVSQERRPPPHARRS